MVSDICGPISFKTYDNFKYFITFLDKGTKYLEIALIKYKSNAFKAFSMFKKQTKNNPSNKK